MLTVGHQLWILLPGKPKIVGCYRLLTPQYIPMFVHSSDIMIPRVTSPSLLTYIHLKMPHELQEAQFWVPGSDPNNALSTCQYRGNPGSEPGLPQCLQVWSWGANYWLQSQGCTGVLTWPQCDQGPEPTISWSSAPGPDIPWVQFKEPCKPTIKMFYTICRYYM